MSPISYGDDVPDESDLRLCGDVAGKRVVELGLGTGTPNAITFAGLGAKTMAVEPSGERVAEARRQAERAEVHVEFHQADLADLGFATSASVELVFSAGALGAVDDLPRVFRQVHRILKPGLARSCSRCPTRSPRCSKAARSCCASPTGVPGARTTSDLFTALQRANFQVDVILEPAPLSHPNVHVPAALVMRARKLGV